MSKIYNVRRAFQRIFNDLIHHDISCIFFNNDVKVMTTLEDSEYKVDHSIILQTILNIRCASITDFSKIIEGLEKLNIKDYISVLVSDGYHTVDNERGITPEDIHLQLHKKFNYSIGLGNDYDRTLLSNISKELYENQSETMFQFLNGYLKKKENNSIILEPNTFFVSFQEFYIVDNHQDEETTLKKYNLIEKGQNQETYEIKENTMITEKEKKHFLFIIDISGSMDDTFHSRIMENFYNDVHIYYGNTEKTRKKIKFYDSQSKILVEKKNDENQSSENDIIFDICQEIYNIEKDPSLKMERLYSLYHKNISNTILKKFIRKKYNELLSTEEKKMVVLLHNEINSKINHKEIYQEYEPICSICYQNPKEILFSCFHTVSCKDCSLKIINRIHPTCPICRKEIEWLRIIKMKEKCIHCSENIPTIYQEPCSHILYCSECFRKENNKLQCKECFIIIEKYSSIHLI